VDGIRDSTTLQRGLDLMLALGGQEAARAGGLGVTRLAEITGEDKSQVSRTLKILAARGLADRDPSTQAYQLGWGVYGLAARAGNQRLLADAPPLLRQLTGEFGERAYLSVLQGGQVLTVWTESPAAAVQAAGWVGHTVPAWCTSSGRVLLADHDRTQLGELLAGVDFVSEGRGAPADVDDLQRRIQAAARTGYAVVDEEFEVGLVAAAAPVRAYHGRVVAAINVSGPKFRLGPRLGDAGPRTAQAAAELSAVLGGAREPGAGQLPRTRPAWPPPRAG